MARQFGRAALTALLFAVLMMLVGCTKGDVSPVRLIAGSIYDATTGLSIEGAKVKVEAKVEDRVKGKVKGYECVTDARGCFKLENIALPSTFKIEFSAEGYEPASSEIHRDPSPAKKEWEYWFGVDLKQETLVK